MSAFMCSNELICGIAQMYCEFVEVNESRSAKQIAKLLWKTNVKSLKVCYREDIFNDIFQYIPNAIPHGDYLLKQITIDCLCLKYQSSQFEGWNFCQAKKIIDSVYMYASSQILNEIKGFSELTWGR